MNAFTLTTLLLILGAGAPAYQIDSTFHPVVGEAREYRVQRGDTLLGIARRFRTDTITLERLNGLHGARLRPGTVLTLPSLVILPETPDEGVVLNIPERAIYLFLNRQLAARYPVAVGMKTWQTPQGKYEILSRVKDPIWETPDEMVRREHSRRADVAGGADNPLGDRWMAWCEVKATDSEVGFHGTNKPSCIGRTVSHACVRLYPECVHDMFERVYEGMPVYSIYEPVKLGRKDDAYYLSVSPDVYDTGAVSLARVQSLLQKVGLWDHVDHAKIARIVARQDGYPWVIAEGLDIEPQSPLARAASRPTIHRSAQRIAARPQGRGSDSGFTPSSPQPAVTTAPAEQARGLEVNGRRVALPLLPVLTNGAWMVPVAPVIAALGGNMDTTPGGMAILTLNGQTLLLTPDSSEAMQQGESVPLSAPVSVVEGNTVAPLDVLAHFCGGRISYRRGEAVRLSTK